MTDPSETGDCGAAQANTPTLPGYTKTSRFELSNPSLRVMGKFWREKMKPTRRERLGLTKPVLSLVKQWPRIRERDGFLYRVIKDGPLVECQQLLLPTCLKEQVLKSVHDQMGHQAIERTLGLLRKRCFWGGVHEDVEQWVKECQRCVFGHLALAKDSGTADAILSYPFVRSGCRSLHHYHCLSEPQMVVRMYSFSQTFSPSSARHLPREIRRQTPQLRPS